MSNSKAIFTPAVSQTFATFIRQPASRQRNGNWPDGLTPADLDFLNPHSTLFHTDAYLISAGQYLNKGLDHYPQPPGAKNLTVIGDSGGYQIIGDPVWYKGRSKVIDVLRWQEAHCTVAPIMDIPTGCVAAGNAVFDSVSKCLATTKQNLAWASVARQSNKLLLLNVAQGRDLISAFHWYDTVRRFKLNGWAFGGATRIDLEILMKLLVRMRDNGDFEDTRWVHMFGVGTIKASLAYTAIRRGLEALLGRDLPVSYDVATPFTNAAILTLKTLPVIGNKKMSLPGIQGLDKTVYVGSTLRLPISFTKLGKRLTAGDLCVNPDIHKDNAWDQLSYQLAACHNLEAMALGYEWAQLAFDLDEELAANLLPRWLVEFRELAPEILKSQKANDLINRNKRSWSNLQSSGDNFDKYR